MQKTIKGSLRGTTKEHLGVVDLIKFSKKVALDLQASMVPDLILRSGSCLCEVSLHALLMSMWDSSGFSGFLKSLKKTYWYSRWIV